MPASDVAFIIQNVKDVVHECLREGADGPSALAPHARPDFPDSFISETAKALDLYAK